MVWNRDDAAPRPRVADDTVVYAIGDMHGRADLLADLHRRIAADVARRRESRRLVVYLRDYVDRGPESRQLIVHSLLERSIELALLLFREVRAVR